MNNSLLLGCVVVPGTQLCRSEIMALLNSGFAERHDVDPMAVEGSL